MKIALDAMGGDFGPPNLVAGAVMALREYPHINKLFLVGDSARIEEELRKHGCNDSRIEITHATKEGFISKPRLRPREARASGCSGERRSHGRVRRRGHD